MPQAELETTSRAIDVELSSLDFCGPLALLLELIEKRRLPITQISLAEVADQYLERVRAMAAASAELLADFLVIGARLLLIKSRALLPSPPQETEEEDVAADLELRLLEYRIFKEAAEKLREIEESGFRSYPRQGTYDYGDGSEPPLEPPPPAALAAALSRMLKALEPDPDRLQLAPRVSVEERIKVVIDLVRAKESATFSELCGNTIDQVVATFLAILELMRRGFLVAEQEQPFTEIKLVLLEARPE
ncbi:MAG TPA: segregation/condensation protein A [Chloroflexota bacterium]